MGRVSTITLWLGEESVIVEPGSVAEKNFRSKGYTEEQKTKQIAIIPKVETKRKRGRSKKVKASGA